MAALVCLQWAFYPYVHLGLQFNVLFGGEGQICPFTCTYAYTARLDSGLRVLASWQLDLAPSLAWDRDLDVELACGLPALSLDRDAGLSNFTLSSWGPLREPLISLLSQKLSQKLDVFSLCAEFTFAVACGTETALHTQFTSVPVFLVLVVVCGHQPVSVLWHGQGLVICS
jgi:hypothetical protein